MDTGGFKEEIVAFEIVTEDLLMESNAFYNVFESSQHDEVTFLHFLSRTILTQE